MRQINLIALLFPTLFLWSCHRGNTLENVKEGIITYKINYLGEELPEAGKEFLPDKMVLMFNEHYSKTSIEGFMGVFDLSLITDLKNRESSTFIKVFDKKCKIFYTDPRSVRNTICGLGTGIPTGITRRTGHVPFRSGTGDRILNAEKIGVEYTGFEIPPFCL